MSIALLIDNPEGSQEIYDKVRKQIGLEEEHPPGRTLHIAGPSPNGGWRVVELWESEEDANRFFKERLEPALKAVGGLTGPPPERQFWSVYNHQ